MKEKIKALSEAYSENLRRHRRTIHKNPEPSFEERETQKYIMSVLDAAGVEYRTFPDYCSVVARIRGKKPGKTIAFRADIDALRLTEENDETVCPYKSRNPGVMHACGHDGHTAVLLTLAEVLSNNTDLMQGDAVLLFQHSEEQLPGGAKFLCEQGVLDDVDEVYGGHLWPSFQKGEVAFTKKEMMASADEFSVIMRSTGGHGSQPYAAKDVLLAGTTAVQQLQNIVAREINALDTAVLSVCSFHAGSAFNVIPDKATISGTVRTFSEDVQKKIIHRIEEICMSTAAMFGVECEVKYVAGYPAVINHPEYVEKAVNCIRELTENTPVETIPVMVGEDFSYYLLKRPGSFFFIGCGNTEEGITKPLHSSTFRMDEGALNVGLETFLALFFGANEN